MTSSLLTAEAPDPADTAQQALTCAALKQGLDPTGAELIYDAHNRVFRLPRVNVIGKVYHPSTRYSEAARQVRVARALLARGILTAASVGRSIMVHGHAVSFSRDLGSERPSDSQYATALRRLHHLPPTGIDFNPKNKIAYTFGQFYTLPPGAVCDTDRIRLHRFLAGAVDAYRQVSRPEYGLVHGDITPLNAVLTDRGTALLDWEYLTLGDLAFDQAASRFAVDAFGKELRKHEEWVAAYGYDFAATNPERYELLVPIMGASSALYYLAWSVRCPQARPEAEHRLDTLLSGRPLPWDWTPVHLVKSPAAGSGSRPGAGA
ncbi:aminoglycoside phosphotransferase family protein [Kitasatospora saccharophila]|uniref:Aminoglycoside phosphotransferase family protein n=1 Tax=Kitasatospora saccharophila TaxID=407973 RepID=A0ABN2XWQ7_9ACTN